MNDLDGSAAAAFEAVYVDASWQGDATVGFTGGLVGVQAPAGTCRTSERAYTGSRRRAAQRMDWDDAELIDWSIYRVFAHPALKG